MQGVDKEIVTGVGFGRVTSFMFEGERIDTDGDPHNSYVFLLAGAVCSPSAPSSRSLPST